MIFCGDTHGLGPVFKLIDKNKIENSNIIHVGDFGLGFQGVHRDIHNLELLDEALLGTNNHLYVIRGNHDFKIFWDKSMGLYLPKFHNLHLVEDNTIIEIEGKNVYFNGGAISIDRRIRKDDKPSTWDENEEFILDEDAIRSRINTLNAMDLHIDIVVTHTAPHFAQPINDNVSIVNDWHKVEMLYGKDLKGELRIERHKLTTLYDIISKNNNIKLWCYGHFHKSYTTHYDSTEFIGLNINELKEIN